MRGAAAWLSNVAVIVVWSTNLNDAVAKRKLWLARRLFESAAIMGAIRDGVAAYSLTAMA